jgi:hypothetical protein
VTPAERLQKNASRHARLMKAKIAQNALQQQLVMRKRVK